VSYSLRAQQKSGLSAEDTNEIRRILCTHMNCGETEVRVVPVLAGSVLHGEPPIHWEGDARTPIG